MREQQPDDTTLRLPFSGVGWIARTELAAVAGFDALLARFQRHAYPILALSAGSLLLTDVHHTADPVLVSLGLLVVGLAVSWLLSGAHPLAVRCFLLTFSTGVLVAGGCQSYATLVHGQAMSAGDANLFYGYMQEFPPYASYAELAALLNAPLAVVIWQWVYRIASSLGMQHGPWLGVLLNCLVVGLSGTVTILIGREALGEDRRALRKIGTLYALCGLFMLFAGLFLRDCFALLANALVFWIMIRTLNRPTVPHVLFALVAMFLLRGFMLGIRTSAIPLFVLFMGLTVACWFFRKRLDLPRVLVLGLLAGGIVFIYDLAVRYANLAVAGVAFRSEMYSSMATLSARQGSLGQALIVNQPLPIRLLIAPFSMMMCPIPIWAYIQPQAEEYHLLKTWHSIYSLLVVPLAACGAAMTVRHWLRNRWDAMPAVLILLFALIPLLAIAATSLETRHYAQFLPAMIILAAIPDRRDAGVRDQTNRAMVTWISLVACLQVAWAVLRYLVMPSLRA